MNYFRHSNLICFIILMICGIFVISACSKTTVQLSGSNSMDSKESAIYSDESQEASASETTSSTAAESQTTGTDSMPVLSTNNTNSGAKSSSVASSVKTSSSTSTSTSLIIGDELKGELTDGVEYTFMNYDTGRLIGIGTSKSFTLKKSGTGFVLLDKSSSKYINTASGPITLGASGTVYTLKHMANGLYTLESGAGKYVRDDDKGTTNFSTTTTIADGGQISAQWYITQKTKKQPFRILPLGDSITEGCDADIAPENYEGYRYKLWKSLVKSGLRFVYVGSIAGNRIEEDGLYRNEGHGGWTIDGTNGIANITDSVILKYDPDMILLQIGTNDCHIAATKNGTIAAGVATISEKLENLLKKIIRKKNSGCIIFLSQITPNMQGARNDWNIAYNATMPGIIVNLNNPGVVLVDNYTPLMNLGAGVNYGLCKDSLHPSATGYTEMSKTWSAAILKKFN